MLIEVENKIVSIRVWGRELADISYTYVKRVSYDIFM